MRVIAFRTLRDFFTNSQYSDSEGALRSWYLEVKTSQWKNANELKLRFRNASVIGDGRVVFNIKGNAYRLLLLLIMIFKSFSLDL